MDNIAKRPEQDRVDLFTETAGALKMTPGVVEKDFWVVWVLGRLFESGLLADKILFKGGTSLSKVFGLIERFSEDIDLILNWNEVVTEDPNLNRSKTKQDQFNKKVSELSRHYIEITFLPEVQRLLGGLCSAEIEEGSPDVINIKYPASFGAGYIRPEIRLEIGPLALWVPNARYEIRPYAAEAFPALFNNPSCHVNAIKAERTFWEKVTILHAEAFRPETKPLPPRYSRHYYDLVMMAADPAVKKSALSDLDLLHTVTEFKARFYPSSWAHYELSRPPTMKLLPPERNLKALANDYQQMQVMFFGKIPEFSDLMNSLGELEKEINASSLNTRMGNKLATKERTERKGENGSVIQQFNDLKTRAENFYER